eukprot:TRINITY_DN10931_c0_g1_i1.p1 TRINITY_DN10931_c0_g1~~TRINITY_DN10931_c0_g1_i1.p1  ORF type:complete len:339 (+),score=-22.51 TRINITY_DN10931_c0_g1_i1:53-1069(+)
MLNQANCDSLFCQGTPLYNSSKNGVAWSCISRQYCTSTDQRKQASLSGIALFIIAILLVNSLLKAWIATFKLKYFQDSAFTVLIGIIVAHKLAKVFWLEEYLCLPDICKLQSKCRIALPISSSQFFYHQLYSKVPTPCKRYQYFLKTLETLCGKLGQLLSLCFPWNLHSHCYDRCYHINSWQAALHLRVVLFRIRCIWRLDFCYRYRRSLGCFKGCPCPRDSDPPCIFLGIKAGIQIIGESVFNDAVTIIMYQTVITAAKAEGVTPAQNALYSVAGFVYLFVSSLVMGVAVGLFTAYLLKVTREKAMLEKIKGEQLLHLSIMIASPIISYLTAQVLIG